MPVTISVDVYEEFEKGLGKEGARKVIKGLENVISDVAEYKWKTTRDDLLDAIRKEFITRELFGERMAHVNQKLNFMIILMIIALTLMNPMMADVVKGFLK